MSFISTADLQLDTFLLSIRSPLFVSVFKAITLLGESVFVIFLTAVVCLVLWRSPRLRFYALGLGIAVTGAGVSGSILKLVIARMRPDGLFSAIAETSYSFPSMHATLSMALYGFMAYALCTLFPARRLAILVSSTLLIAVIGFSRLYLGVHFPSDVLAGYLLGGAWIVAGIRVAKMNI